MNPPEMNTSQLLLVSTLGLAVNLFGMFAMGGHHHHVSLSDVSQGLRLILSSREVIRTLMVIHTVIHTNHRLLNLPVIAMNIVVIPMVATNCLHLLRTDVATIMITITLTGTVMGTPTFIFMSTQGGRNLVTHTTPTQAVLMEAMTIASSRCALTTMRK